MRGFDYFTGRTVAEPSRRFNRMLRNSIFIGGPVNFDDATEREKYRQDDLHVVAAYLDLVFLVKTKTPQVIRVQSPPADAHRKRRVTALLETAVEGIASNRHHPQPAMHCSWCQYRTECMAWLPGMTVEEIHRKYAA